MLVIISKCEKCGSPIFSQSFSQTTKGFADAHLVRTCRCFAENYVTHEEVNPDGGAEEADQSREAGEA